MVIMIVYEKLLEYFWYKDIDFPCMTDRLGYCVYLSTDPLTVWIQIQNLEPKA